ncbi:hypothetical protein KJ997_04530 [bacterium]|nr:hypothetical protein [bacterium]
MKKITKTRDVLSPKRSLLIQRRAVMNAATKPQLYIIQNPAENLEPEEKVEVVRYVVPFEEIITKGNESGD